MTPPAITQHIKRFEESIGIRLLVREAHSIRLTSAGEGVLRRAEKILEEIHEMEGYLEDLSSGKSGDLRVGCPEAALRNLAPMIETFKRTYPGVKIVLDQGSNAEMVRSIVDHRNELAVVRYSPNSSRLKVKALWREEIVLVTSPKACIGLAQNSPSRSCLRSRWSSDVRAPR